MRDFEYDDDLDFEGFEQAVSEFGVIPMEKLVDYGFFNGMRHEEAFVGSNETHSLVLVGGSRLPR